MTPLRGLRRPAEPRLLSGLFGDRRACGSLRPIAACLADRYAILGDASLGKCHGGPMSREFSVVIERDEEGYYVASVPASCPVAIPRPVRSTN